MNENMSRVRFGNKLLWRGVFFVGFVLVGLGLSGITAAYIVSYGIEWVSVTNAGMTVNGLWLMVAAGLAEFLTDRIFRQLPENLDQGGSAGE